MRRHVRRASKAAHGRSSMPLLWTRVAPGAPWGATLHALLCVSRPTRTWRPLWLSLAAHGHRDDVRQLHHGKESICLGVATLWRLPGVWVPASAALAAPLLQWLKGVHRGLKVQRDRVRRSLILCLLSSRSFACCA